MTCTVVLPPADELVQRGEVGNSQDCAEHEGSKPSAARHGCALPRLEYPNLKLKACARSVLQVAIVPAEAKPTDSPPPHDLGDEIRQAIYANL